MVVSMLNFHLGRYSLFLLPSLCLLVAQSFFVIYQHLRIGFIKAIAVAVLLIMPFPYYASKMFNFDADMGFTNAVKVHTQAIEFLNRNYASGTVIMDSFPINLCMTESRAGYGSRTFQHIDRSCDSPEKVDAEVFIYTFPGNLEHCAPKKDQLTLIKEFKSSFASVLIYEKRQK
jgi:hypothetical protein